MCAHDEGALTVEPTRTLAQLEALIGHEGVSAEYVHFRIDLLKAQWAVRRAFAQALSAGDEHDRTQGATAAHNRRAAPVFDEAAFALFLIAQLGAIVPMYRERSLHYASIEAGLMAQLLEMSAPAYGIGLCQIGTLEFQRIRHFFALDEGHVLVHSLLGGSIDTQQESHWSSHQEPYYHMPSMEEEREEGEI